MFDLSGLIAYTRDIEVDSADFDLDNGRNIKSRFEIQLAQLRLEFMAIETIDVHAAAYFSNAKTDPILGGASLSGTSGFSATPLGDISDQSSEVNVDINEPFHNGLSFNVEYFNIGENYESIWASRRESDVLLTEGFDSTFVQPGPMNVAFGVFGGSGDAPQPGGPTVPILVTVDGVEIEFKFQPFRLITISPILMNQLRNVYRLERYYHKTDLRKRKLGCKR